MGIRSTIASAIGGDAIDTRVRQVVEEILATKGFARPADLQELRDKVTALEAQGGSAAGASPVDGDAEQRISALETEIQSLRKKQTMAMGAIQAATAQLADARRTADEARSDARQALARAESALATAESLSDGVEALEEAVEGRGDEPAGKVNINTAGKEALEALSGIGPSMAVRILEDREANGPFHSVSDLTRVKGLGGATVKKLADELTV